MKHITGGPLRGGNILLMCPADEERHCISLSSQVPSVTPGKCLDSEYGLRYNNWTFYWSRGNYNGPLERKSINLFKFDRNVYSRQTVSFQSFCIIIPAAATAVTQLCDTRLVICDDLVIFPLRKKVRMPSSVDTKVSRTEVRGIFV